MKEEVLNIDGQQEVSLFTEEFIRSMYESEIDRVAKMRGLHLLPFYEDFKRIALKQHSTYLEDFRVKSLDELDESKLYLTDKFKKRINLSNRTVRLMIDLTNLSLIKPNNLNKTVKKALKELVPSDIIRLATETEWAVDYEGAGLLLCHELEERLEKDIENISTEDLLQLEHMNYLIPFLSGKVIDELSRRYPNVSIENTEYFQPAIREFRNKIKDGDSKERSIFNNGIKLYDVSLEGALKLEEVTKSSIIDEAREALGQDWRESVRTSEESELRETRGIKL